MIPETPPCVFPSHLRNFPVTLAPGGTPLDGYPGQLRDSPRNEDRLQTGSSTGVHKRIPSAVKIKKVAILFNDQDQNTLSSFAMLRFCTL